MAKATIIVDSREQKNKHITDYFDKKNIPWIVRKLDFGDYSLIWQGKDYSPLYAVERKNNWSELAINLTSKNKQFQEEWVRSKGCRMVLMIEDTEDNLLTHSYRSRLKPESYLKTLTTLKNKYMFAYELVSKQGAGAFIIRYFTDMLTGICVKCQKRFVREEMHHDFCPKCRLELEKDLPKELEIIETNWDDIDPMC